MNLTYVFPRTSTTTATCGWCSLFTIRSLGVLLLDVRIECRIAEIGLHAVIAFKVAPFDVVLGPPFSFTSAIFCAIIFIIVVAVLFASSHAHVAAIASLLLICTSHTFLVLTGHLLAIRSHAMLLGHVLTDHIGYAAHHLLRIRVRGASCSVRESHLHHAWIHHSCGHLALTHHVLLLHVSIVLHLLVILLARWLVIVLVVH